MLKTGYKLTDEDKLKYSLAEQCFVLELPELVPVAEEIQSLGYDTKPDYGKLRFLFSKILMNMNEVPCEQNYDWNTNFMIDICS